MRADRVATEVVIRDTIPAPINFTTAFARPKMNHYRLALTKLSYDKNTGIFTWGENNPKNPKKGKTAGFRKDGYINIEVHGKAIRAHRLAWFSVHNEIPNEIDHINGIRSDNRISNLRKSTRHQNCCNKKVRKDSGTGFKGVHYCKKSGKYKGDVSVKRKRYHIGYFKTLEEARAAVMKFRNKHHMEFANHG